MLRANCVLDCDVCDAVRRSSALLHSCTVRFEVCNCSAASLCDRLPAQPLSQSSRERVARSFLMLKRSPPGAVGHFARAIRDARIATRRIERSNKSTTELYADDKETTAWLAGS